MIRGEEFYFGLWIKKRSSNDDPDEKACLYIFSLYIHLYIRNKRWEYRYVIFLNLINWVLYEFV